MVALKFIEDNKPYEIDEYFYERLSDCSLEEAGNVIAQVLSVVNNLPQKSGWAQEIAGVILKNDPVFFVVEFLNQQDEIPIFVDLSFIEVDEYLDFITRNQTIKQYYYERRNDGYINEERTGDRFFTRNNQNTPRS